MNIQIIADSCVDHHPTLFSDQPVLQRVPFKISLKEDYIDQDLDIAMLLREMKASKNPPLTAAPSPNDFMKAMVPGSTIFLVTISSKLSGSYANARIAREQFLETHPDTVIHLFDTKTAASGEVLVILKIKSLIKAGCSTEDIVAQTNQYIGQLNTLFVLNSLDNLSKNGRISGTAAIMGKLLGIVPIMGEDGDGSIVLKLRARGKKQAFEKLMDLIGETAENVKNTIMAITHVNALEQAEELKTAILKRFSFFDIFIFESSGLSTVYADDGGIVLAF